MASKDSVEEEMELSGDSTVEYLGSSTEYESDSSSEFPSSEGDSDDSDGSSVDGSDTEEIVTEGDDGNYDNDSWKCTGEDCSADELLDRYTFSSPAVGGHPRNCIPPDSRPEEYVCMFLGVLLEEIVVDTNVYGRRKFSLKSACPDNNHRAWVDITLEEMKAFLGLAVNMSLTRKGDVKEYWSLNPSQAFPFFRQVFTRDRFLDILYSLHYPALEGSVHKLKKVLYLVQHLSQQYQRFYLPEREICVDESIIGFQGRTPATQYMPNKHHHRWGLKLWCLCESSSGYTWNFYMYGGADDAVGETIVDKSGDVVIRLISPLLGYGYHMYTDNYFTSIPLAMYLYIHRTYLTGTTRCNRVGLPEPVRRKLAKKGDVMNYRRGPLLACAFEDKKHVIILSTHGTGRTGEYTSKRNRKRVTPGCVHQYNKYMGGVELSDMRIYCFQDERRTIRWNIKVFFLLFGRTLLNSFLVYQRNSSSSPMVYRKFLERVVDGLVGTFRMPRTQRNRVLPIQVPLQPPPPQDRLIHHVDHRIQVFPDGKANRCKVCYARGGKKKVRYCCKRCDVALCVVDYFWAYHYLVDYTVAE